MLVYHRVNCVMKGASKVSDKRYVKIRQVIVNEFFTFPCGSWATTIQKLTASTLARLPARAIFCLNS